MVSNMYGIHMMYWRCLCDASATQYAIFTWKLITIEKYFQCVFRNPSNLPGFFFANPEVSPKMVLIWDYRMFGTISSSIILHLWFQVFIAMFTYAMVVENNYLQFALKKRSWGCFKDPQIEINFTLCLWCFFFPGKSHACMPMRSIPLLQQVLKGRMVSWVHLTRDRVDGGDQRNQWTRDT